MEKDRIKFQKNKKYSPFCPLPYPTDPLKAVTSTSSETSTVWIVKENGINKKSISSKSSLKSMAGSGPSSARNLKGQPITATISTDNLETKTWNKESKEFGTLLKLFNCSNSFKKWPKSSSLTKGSSNNFQRPMLTMNIKDNKSWTESTILKISSSTTSPFSNLTLTPKSSRQSISQKLDGMKSPCTSKRAIPLTAETKSWLCFKYFSTPRQNNLMS